MRARNVVALLALFLIATGASIKSNIVNTEGSTAPTDTRVPWTRDRDRQQMVYNDSLGKWLGEKVKIIFARNATNVTGFLRVASNGVPSDTTTGQEDGFYEPDTLRLVEVIGNASHPTGGVNCTTYVFADQDTLVKLVWPGAEKTSWTPTADSTGGWISSDGTSVTRLTAQIMSVALVAKSAGAINPNYPILRFVFREEVSP